MRLHVALARAALLLCLADRVVAGTEPPLGASAGEVRAGSLATEPAKDGSAGAESITSAPTPTPTPSVSATTVISLPPIPIPSPTTTPPLPPPALVTTAPPPAPTTVPPTPPTTSPPPSPPSPPVDGEGSNFGPSGTKPPAPPPTPTPTPPTPTPSDPGSPQPPDSPSPPVVQPGEVAAPTSPAATPVPVGSPTSVPLIPDPLSPSPPGAIGTDTPQSGPSTTETRESRAPSPTGSAATSSPYKSSSSSSSSGGAGVAPTPTTLEYSVGTSGTTTNPPRVKQYRRGDNVILVKKQLSDGTTVDVEVVVSGSNSPALLVRDVATKSSTGSDTKKTHSAGWFASVVSTLAVVTLLLLFLTHFVAVESSFTASLGFWIRPNQWELLVFITYIQAMASTAHYAITAVPTSLWAFLDAFSWTVFIPNHHSDSAITVKTDSPSRRLTEVVVLDGLIAFSDRIGVDETSLLQTAVTGMVVIGIVVLLISLAIVVLIKSRRDKKELAKTSTDPFGLGVLPRTLAIDDNVQPVRVKACPPVVIMFGVVVVLGVFALYPVTLLATFEIVSQIRAQIVAAKSLAIAGVVVFIVPALLLVGSISVLMAVESDEEFKSEQKYRAVWGVVGSSECVRFESRVVFVCAWLAMQLTSALVVGTVISATWQLVLLLAIDVAFVAVILLNRPFTDGNQAATITTAAVGVLKALNTSLALAFSSGTSTTSPRHQGVATAFIAINSLVLALWCVRQLFTTYHVLRLYWTHHSARKNTVESSLPESNNAQSVPPSQFSHSPSGAQYESTLYVALASTQEGHRGTAVL